MPKIRAADLHGNHHQQQVALIEYVHRVLVPLHPDAGMIFHPANGGKRDGITAAQLQAEGVLAGVPDLCLPLPSYGKSYIGWWGDIKVPPDRASKEQADYKRRLEAYHHFVIFGEWEALARSLVWYLGLGGKVEEPEDGVK